MSGERTISIGILSSGSNVTNNVGSETLSRAPSQQQENLSPRTSAKWSSKPVFCENGSTIECGSLSLGTVEGAESAIGRLSDGGIDGLIKEDVLGLDAIYVQAKRWQNTILIDGEQLAQFMIKYDPGVSVEESIEIKEIDIDYFRGYSSRLAIVL